MHPVGNHRLAQSAFPAQLPRCGNPDVEVFWIFCWQCSTCVLPPYIKSNSPSNVTLIPCEEKLNSCSRNCKQNLVYNFKKCKSLNTTTYKLICSVAMLCCLWNCSKHFATEKWILCFWCPAAKYTTVQNLKIITGFAVKKRSKTSSSVLLFIRAGLAQKSCWRWMSWLTAVSPHKSSIWCRWSSPSFSETLFPCCPKRWVPEPPFFCYQFTTWSHRPPSHHLTASVVVVSFFCSAS